MKRLIQDKRTKQFLTADGHWTCDISAAEDFTHITLAIKAEQKHQLKAVELLLMMEEKPSSYDIKLPLGYRSVSIHKRERNGARVLASHLGA